LWCVLFKRGAFTTDFTICLCDFITSGKLLNEVAIFERHRVEAFVLGLRSESKTEGVLHRDLKSSSSSAVEEFIVGHALSCSHGK
jgi:hypothetical protein